MPFTEQSEVNSPFTKWIDDGFNLNRVAPLELRHDGKALEKLLEDGKVGLRGSYSLSSFYLRDYVRAKNKTCMA